ncbi:MAG: D-alanine--D-alanine ligase [Planctomycetota bacterium]
MSPRARVLVLAGGPDAERSVSIDSATAVAAAIQRHGQFDAELCVIDSPDSLRHLPGDVVFPVLHGPWGEGGPLQDVLEHDGRPYVGAEPAAARLCMDKLATKSTAEKIGVRTAEAAAINTHDVLPPLAAPAIIKPVFEGSSVGLRLCRDDASLRAAFADARESGTPMMIERLIDGAEITCGLIDRGRGLKPLPIIEIAAARGTYDYDAKYDRDDTIYTVGSDAAPAADHQAVQSDTRRLAEAIGVRHLARADFMVDLSGRHWLLEINTMPGFTGHSLLPKAAAAMGIGMGMLCTKLCVIALTRHSSSQADPVETLSHGTSEAT